MSILDPSSETTGYRLVGSPGSGGRRKRCSTCKRDSLVRSKRCDYCCRKFVKPVRKPKPARGSEERIAADLRTAKKMSDVWSKKAATAAQRARFWALRERTLAARLQAAAEAKLAERNQVMKARRAVVVGGALVK